MVRLELEAVARRLASFSKRVVEDVVVDAINYFLSDLLDLLVYEVALGWDEVIRWFARTGAEPTRENLLAAVDELSDAVDIDRAIGSSGSPTSRVVLEVVDSVAGLARRLLPRETLERLTYENVLEQARRRGMAEVVEYMTRYPRISRKVVDWLRSRLLAGG